MSLLKCVSSPGELYALSNKVFVSPNSDIARNKFIKINKMLFVIDVDDSIEKDKIAFNKSQRDSLNIKLNDIINVEPFDSYKQLFDKKISTIKIILTPSAKSREINIETKDLLHEMTKFNEYPFTVSQQLMLWITPNYNITGFISDILVENDKTTFGLFTNETTILFESATQNLKIHDNTISQSIFNTSLNLTDLGIGGLKEQFSEIFRRAFASRLLSDQVAEKLGVTHTRGIVLYGPPGCGKTLLARQIGKMLKCVEPKIVSGPSLLDKYVGESEKNIRDLFGDAMKDTNKRNIHLIICDEFDALCKQRGMTKDGTGVGDNVVNQFLSMIDGPKQLDNVLLICMTNRLDIIDEAILRPGRLEIHIEISLPDTNGRQEILNIHTRKMRENNCLAPDVNITELAEITKNFTGAELEGLVRSARSFAISREIDIESNIVTIDKNILPIISMSDFKLSINDIVPMFGKVSNELNNITATKFIMWDNKIQEIYDDIMKNINLLKFGNLYSVLITGSTYIGKTKFVAELAKNTNISLIKMISCDRLTKCTGDKSIYIRNMFDQCLKAESSIIILDSIERLIEWSDIGYKYNNSILQTIVSMLRESISKDKKIIILCTSIDKNILKELKIFDLFDNQINFPDFMFGEDAKKIFNYETNSEIVYVSEIFKKMKFTN